MPRRRRGPREKDITERYLSGNLDVDRVEAGERFTDRSKNAEQNKILKTTAAREEGISSSVDWAALPAGRVIQVHSLYCSVRHEGATYLCVKRKTMERVSKTAIVVGDEVRFRPAGGDGILRAASLSPDSPDGVIEGVEPRRTVLTRADSFKGTSQHPIVANAERMMIVVGLAQPRPKWGLVDRMIVAAMSGGLEPVVCLNKMDLKGRDKDAAASELALEHYRGVLKIRVLRTSATTGEGLDDARNVLRGRVTVLAGHSGVGKSSLVNAIEPGLDLRTAEVSGYTDKGRHTTTSARYFELGGGGAVIDTPGVKLFGLWNITGENLRGFFPDVESGEAPEWRVESFERIVESLAE